MRFYRALLRLYPASFRAEYGEEILSVLGRRRALLDRAGRVRLAAETVLDTLVNASRVQTDILSQDLRFSVRTLRRAPAFTLTAVLLCTLGIGATTAAVAIADHVLLRPLPFPGAERLVRFWQMDTGTEGYNVLSPGNYRDLLNASSAFESAAAYTPQSANLVGHGAPVRLEGYLATGDLFNVLGTRPLVGRVFTPADALETSDPVVVLAYRTWATLFNMEATAIGRPVLLNGTPHTVIGVMPSGFLFPDRDTQFWAPLTLPPAVFDDRSNTYLWTIARLKPGRTIAQADAELDAVAAELARRFPKENPRLGVLTVDLRGDLTPASRTMITGVVAAAACLLLIAGTNLAGLLLSRSLSRQQEFAVRTAIGAGPERLVRQMLTESFLIAAAGGVLGVLLAVVSTPLLAQLVPTTLPIAAAPAADLRLAGLAAALSLVTALVFGALPARRPARGDLDALKATSRTGASRRTEVSRSVLVVGQVAASVVLLISVGLLGQALWRVQSRDPGFVADRVLTLRTSLPWPKYGPAPARQAFYQRVLTDVRALPGVEGAGYITGLPMAVGGLIWEVAPEGAAPVEAGLNRVGLRMVTPGYFDAMTIAIKEGRDVAWSDTRDAPFVAVVSASFAQRFWPGRTAIGRRFNLAFFDRTIVGVAADVRVRGLERASEPQVYLPSGQVPDFGLINSPPKDLVVRAASAPLGLLPSIRTIISRADPEQPISQVRLLSDVVAEQTGPRTTQVRVLAGFAGAAVLLAAVGVYGLLAFAVSQRTREIGLRMALGATPASMVALVVRRGAALAASGALAGVAVAYAAARWMESLLAGVSPHDVTVFAAAIGLTALIALCGTILPARRASRVSPLTATRAE